MEPRLNMSREFTRLYNKHGDSWSNQEYTDELSAIMGKEVDKAYVCSLKSKIRNLANNKPKQGLPEASDETVKQTVSVSPAELPKQVNVVDRPASAVVSPADMRELDQLFGSSQPMYTLEQLSAVIHLVQMFNGDLHKMKLVIDLLCNK